MLLSHGDGAIQTTLFQKGARKMRQRSLRNTSENNYFTLCLSACCRDMENNNIDRTSYITRRSVGLLIKNYYYKDTMPSSVVVLGFLKMEVETTKSQRNFIL